MADNQYQYGRAARMLVTRRYLGLERAEMAAVLKVRESSYQRWENGQAAIPEGVWAQLDQLMADFDTQVARLLEQADGGQLSVTIWRGRTQEQPLPGMWHRIVSEAMRENPKIEPTFPEDKQD